MLGSAPLSSIALGSRPDFESTVFSVTAQESGTDTVSVTFEVANGFSITAQESGTDTVSVTFEVANGFSITAQESGEDIASLTAAILDNNWLQVGPISTNWQQGVPAASTWTAIAVNDDTLTND